MSAQRQQRENPDLVQHGLRANTDGEEEKAFLVTNGYHRLPQVTNGYCQVTVGGRQVTANGR